jgi:hypothetical protein
MANLKPFSFNYPRNKYTIVSSTLYTELLNDEKLLLNGEILKTNILKKCEKIIFNKSCDEYSNLVVTFCKFIDCNIINNGNPIYRISGRLLCLYLMLMPNFNKKYIKLPFNKHTICTSQQSCLEIQYNKPNKKMINDAKKLYSDILDKYMILPISHITQKYLANYVKFGKTEISCSKLIISNNYKNIKRERKDESKDESKKFIPIESFQNGKSFKILSGQSYAKGTCQFNLMGTKLIFAFRKIDAPNTEVLPILVSGTLSIDGNIHTQFTKRMVHIADKFVYDNYIPDVEIYTITFENQEYLNNNQHEPNSHYCASRSEELVLNVEIEPQDFDVECTVHLIAVNYLLGANDMYRSLYFST